MRVESESVIVNPRELGIAGLLREVVRARRVGPGPETVFRLLRPFHGPRFDAIYRRVMADDTGRRILQAGRSLQPILLDLDHLRSLPDDTLGRQYARFMDENAIDIVSFAEASLRHMAREDYATEEAWTLANRLRDIHEIVHVLSGYGTDELGEMGELAFNLREDPRPNATRLAIRVNIASFRRRGHDHAEDVIRRAFERGRRVGLMVGADWEAMLDRRLEDVRVRLGMDAPEAYAPIPPTGEAPALRDLIGGWLRRLPAEAAAA